MAHLIEEYSKSAGVKIGRPEVYEDYFPMIIERYITLHTTSKPAKTYQYWQEVVNLIKPHLDAMGISIVQIGGKDDIKIDGIFDICGQTSFNQTAYIIKDSLLHVGVDSFPVHVASGYGKKIVCLYSNNYVECVGPYWTKSEDFIGMTSYKDGKPLYSLDDPERIIDKIKPEDIAKNILKLLGKDVSFDFKTIYIGNKFMQKHFEIAPDAVANIDDKGAPLVIRMDYSFNQDNMIKQIASHGHCYIITEKPFDIKSVMPYKNNIKQIQYNFRKDYDVDFAKQIYESGIPFGLNCQLPEEGNEHIKLDFMDFAIVTFEKIFDPKTADEFKDVNFDNLYYKACKVVSCNGRNFYGKQGWSKNDEVKNFGEWKKAYNTIDLWREVDFLYFVEKI